MIQAFRNNPPIGNGPYNHPRRPQAAFAQREPAHFVAPPRAAAPRYLPPELAAEKRQYQQHVRALQGINRFRRKRAVADQLLLPVRSLFAFSPIPIPGLHWLGVGFNAGLQNAHVATHEGREPERMRKHLFEAETSRHQSSKIVGHLVSIGVLDKEHRYVRGIGDDELKTLQRKFKLQDEAAAKISWALEVFPQITAEATGEQPSRYAAALPGA